MPFLVATNSTFERSQRRKRFDRRSFGLQLFGEIGELLDLAPIDRLEQRLAGREMPVQRADADAGVPRHGLQAGIWAAGAEHRFCRLQHPLAIADRIGARLARWSCSNDAPISLVNFLGHLKAEAPSVYAPDQHGDRAVPSQSPPRSAHSGILGRPLRDLVGA